MIRILGESSPEVAAVLDLLSKTSKKRKSERNGQHAQRGGAQDNEIETAIIQALAPLQDTLHFDGLISKTNDYNQTLAHFAILFGFINLLRQLMEWHIDLTIADVNGLTALHFAYKKGDRACVELLLNYGASETVLDALGRAPSHLMPDGFDSPDHHGIGTASDGRTEFGEQFNGASLSQSNGLGYETPDPDSEKSMGDSERACQKRLDRVDVHTPVASPCKAVDSGSMDRAQYNTPAFDYSSSCANQPSQSTQVSFNPSLHNNIAPPTSALDGGAGRNSSIYQDAFSPHGVPVYPAIQPPQLPQFNRRSVPPVDLPMTDRMQRDLEELRIAFLARSWHPGAEPIISSPDCPALAEQYGERGRSCYAVFVYEHSSGRYGCRHECCSQERNPSFRSMADAIRHQRLRHFS
jgi:hypothetical protein